MSGVPDEMPDIPETDDRGKYDSLFFRIGGGISVLGVALVSFFLYQGVNSDESLAAAADVTHLRLEATLVGVGIVLLGLCVAVGGPVLSRKVR